MAKKLVGGGVLDDAELRHRAVCRRADRRQRLGMTAVLTRFKATVAGVEDLCGLLPSATIGLEVTGPDTRESAPARPQLLLAAGSGHALRPPVVRVRPLPRLQPGQDLG